MVTKSKPSRKEKRLQKKLKRLDEELSSDDEEGEAAQPQTQHQDTKATTANVRSAASVRLLQAAQDEEAESSSDGGEGDVSSAEDEDDDGAGESFDEMDEDGDEEAEQEGGGKDGMADVMARILKQDVAKKTPVLAKRKTALMKDMEKEKKARAKAKEAAEQKRAALNHQLYVPDHKDAERERKLRRIATRGVVALFNAVTRARQAQEAGGDLGGGAGKRMWLHASWISLSGSSSSLLTDVMIAKIQSIVHLNSFDDKDAIIFRPYLISQQQPLPMSSIATTSTHAISPHPLTPLAGKAGKGTKDMSKRDFLEMLKSSTTKTGSKTGSSKAAAAAADAVTHKGNPFLDADAGKATAASWAAIQDDYLMKAPKINDYDESEEEEEEIEGEGMLSESEGE